VTASEFIASGVVAFSGSRHGSPFGINECVMHVVLKLHLPVAVGCQRGVDAVVRFVVANCGGTGVVHSVGEEQYKHLPIRARYAARTVACVSSANCLLAFAPESGVLGIGTALAVRTALKLGLPVFVAAPVAPVVGSGWVAASFAGVSGWSWHPVQESLF